MNILMLNYEFPPIGGGAANAHLCLLRQYAGREDLKLDVLTSAPRPGFFTEAFAQNINIYKVGIHKKQLHYWRKIEVLEWLLKAGPHYRRLLRENSYDLVHAFFGFPTGWLCYRTADEIPYIISLRGSDVPGKHARLALDYKILAPLFRAIWRKASALVACSEGLKDRALRFLPSAAIDVIPNGVDGERFYPCRTRQQSDELKLITVGRLSLTKRVDLLIEAVEILIGQGYKIRLSVIGGGNLQNSLRQLVSEKKLDGFIEISGRIEPQDMPELYRKSDLYVSASVQEGMSNAMLEAMASGLPIVTTRCEGLEELIADNGIVVEQAGADQIAGAVKKLADDGHLRVQMSLAARRQAEKFTWGRAAEQYLTIYERIK
jgi:glycosyltransferase involved in cell wall biosynthesis